MDTDDRALLCGEGSVLPLAIGNRSAYWNWQPKQKSIARRRRLGAGDVGSLKSFGAFVYFKFHGFAFIQAAVSRLLNCREVDEHVFSCRTLNESIALGPVEPLDCAFFSHNLTPFA